uniref:Uncharacterized protein n=1 Tax=Magallana gigas TaxID=29159 RepID=K1QP73_MAGGI
MKIRNGNLFDYEGEHRTYVMQFQGNFTGLPTPDLILVIEVDDVKEASDTVSLSSGSSGCCDDVTTIRWMVPAFAAVVLVVLIIIFARELLHNKLPASNKELVFEMRTRKDTVVKEIDLRSEYHYWEDNHQRPINGKTLFHDFDIVNLDRRPIKIAHCEAVDDVTIQIGLNGRNGMPNIPPSKISTVQINCGYFREAFALLRYYSGNVADY